MLIQVTSNDVIKLGLTYVYNRMVTSLKQPSKQNLLIIYCDFCRIMQSTTIFYIYSSFYYIGHQRAF